MLARRSTLSACKAFSSIDRLAERSLRENGSIKNIPKAWTPDGMTWANGSTIIGYTVYRTVTMPDGTELIVSAHSHWIISQKCIDKCRHGGIGFQP